MTQENGNLNNNFLDPIQNSTDIVDLNFKNENNPKKENKPQEKDILKNSTTIQSEHIKHSPKKNDAKPSGFQNNQKSQPGEKNANFQDHRSESRGGTTE